VLSHRSMCYNSLNSSMKMVCTCHACVVRRTFGTSGVRLALSFQLDLHQIRIAPPDTDTPVSALIAHTKY
jgi:hypothetical protein